MIRESDTKGTEPFDECPLHNGPGLLARIGGIFGAGTSPGLSRALRVAAAGARGRARGGGDGDGDGGRERKAGREPKKKRGFWSRIFGSRKTDSGRRAGRAAQASVRAHVPFRDLMGHRAQQTLLARAITCGALPQSLILRRPRRRRKLLVALALAQRLNCLTRGHGRLTGPVAPAARAGGSARAAHRTS